MKKTAFWRWALPIGIVLWTLFIWSRSLMSADASTADSNAVAAWLTGGALPFWLTYAVRKGAHFAEFALLGALWGGQHRLRPLPLCWLYGLPIGAIDEALQFLAPGRAPMVTDVLIDLAGYLCGWGLVWAVTYLRQKKVK